MTILSGWHLMGCQSHNINLTPHQLESHAFVMELDGSGNLIWQKDVKVGQVTAGWSIADADNLVVAGTGGELIDNKSEKFVWFARLENGDFMVHKYVDDFRFETLALGIAKILKLKDGYLLMSNACNGECIWLMKVGEDGKVVWEKRYEEYFHILKEKNVENDIGYTLSPEFWIAAILFALLPGWFLLKS